MHGAEAPRKTFWSLGKRIASAMVVVVAISVWCVRSYGLGPVLAVWNTAKSVSVKTVHDILGNGSAGIALEADVASSTDIVSEDVQSSTSVQVDSSESVQEDLSMRSDSGIRVSGKKSAIVINTNGSKESAVFASPPAMVPSGSLPSSTQSLSAVNVPATSSQKNSAIIPAPACSAAATSEPTHKILFNEIAWMGSVPAYGETGTQAGNREWMELRNNSGADVDMSGWQILDDSGKFKIGFDQGTHFNFGEFFLLERGDEGSVPGVAADKIYTGTLANSGAWLRLLDRDCALVDEINASSGWPGGDNSTKATLERDLMDFDWHTSGYPGGTPKAENSVVWKGGVVQATSPPATITVPTSTVASSSSTIIDAVTSTSSDIQPTPSPDPPPPSPAMSPPVPPVPAASSPAHLVIAAVQIAGAAASNDFLKIFNPTSAPVDLGGWRLRKRTGTGTESSLRVLPSGSVIAAQRYFIWANSASGFAASIGADASSSETLAAGNSVAIEDASSTIIDALAWGIGSTNQFVEGSAFPTDPAANQVLSRKSAGGVMQDTDSNQSDFEMQQ